MNQTRAAVQDRVHQVHPSTCLRNSKGGHPVGIQPSKSNLWSARPTAIYEGSFSPGGAIQGSAQYKHHCHDKQRSPLQS